MLVLPVQASATYEDVLADCTAPSHNEQLTKTYTHAEYQEALDNMGLYVKEYTGCYGVIRDAMVAAASGGSSAAVGPSSAPGASASGGNGTAENPAAATGVGPADPLAAATPADQAALSSAQARGSGPIQVGPALIAPGAPASVTGSFGRLPLPIIAMTVLALVALAAVTTKPVWTRGRR